MPSPAVSAPGGPTPRIAHWAEAPRNPVQGQDPQHFSLGQDLVIPGQGVGECSGRTEILLFSVGVRPETGRPLCWTHSTPMTAVPTNMKRRLATLHLMLRQLVAVVMTCAFQG